VEPEPGTYTARGETHGTVGYAERLVLPWWLWLPSLGVATLLAAEVHLGAPGLRSWLPYAVILPLSIAALWRLGRIRVAVEDGPDGVDLRVDDARLPVRYVSTAVPLDANGKREILGPLAHPMAFVVQRPWVSGAVQVMLDDPADPTPYWVVSSRNPQRLAAALLAATAASADAEAGVTGRR
jgi:Protein of unknown function (DUF3093)